MWTTPLITGITDPSVPPWMLPTSTLSTEATSLDARPSTVLFVGLVILGIESPASLVEPITGSAPLLVELPAIVLVAW